MNHPLQCEGNRMFFFVRDKPWWKCLISVFGNSVMLKIKFPFMTTIFCKGRGMGTLLSWNHRSLWYSDGYLKEATTAKLSICGHVNKNTCWMEFICPVWSLGVVFLCFYWIQSNGLCMSSQLETVSSQDQNKSWITNSEWRREGKKAVHQHDTIGYWGKISLGREAHNSSLVDILKWQPSPSPYKHFLSPFLEDLHDKTSEALQYPKS